MTASDTPPPLTDEQLARLDELMASCPEEFPPGMRGLYATLSRLRAERDSLNGQLNEALAGNVRRLGEITGLRAELHGRRNLGVEYERLRVENIALAGAVKTVATALDSLGGRIYRDLRDEYDDIAERVSDEDAKLLREFNAYAEEQLSVLNEPAVRAALGETGGTDER